jgi:hypothetical protein
MSKSMLMKYLMNSWNITLSFQNFVKVLLLILNYSCWLKLYALFVTIAHLKYEVEILNY